MSYACSVYYILRSKMNLQRGEIRGEIISWRNFLESGIACQFFWDFPLFNAAYQTIDTAILITERLATIFINCTRISQNRIPQTDRENQRPKRNEGLTKKRKKKETKIIGVDRERRNIGGFRSFPLAAGDEIERAKTRDQETWRRLYIRLYT